MGKLNYNPYIKHFSHEHPLELFNIQTKPLKPSSCSACKLEPFGWIYTCRTCNYILHVSCSQMPQFINHPSHPNHPLTLLPSPPYPEGFFNCDACNRQGYGFCYHCTACDFDIHISCASLPLALNHGSHHHPLNLTFHLPYQTKGFSCDICRNLGSNGWIYRCNLCDFDAHLDCARTTTTANQTAFVQQSQPLLQHHHLFPAAGANTHQSQPIFQHYNSFPTAGANHPPPRVQVMNDATHQLPNYYVNTTSNPNVASVMQQNSVLPLQTNLPPPRPGINNNYANNNNNTVMGMAIQGFVEGAAQQVGQNFVQNLMGSSSAGDNKNVNGGDFAGGGVYNVDSSSTSGFDIGNYEE